MCWLLLSLFCCCLRRCRRSRCLHWRLCCWFCSRRRRRRCGHRVLHRALRRGLRRGQIAGLGGGRADNIIHVGRLCCLHRHRAARHRHSAVFRRFKALLNRTAKHRRLTIQRQKQCNFAGRCWLKVLHVHQLGWQHFGARVLRVASLPVGNTGLQHLRVGAVVKPHLLEIKPALQHVLIRVDDQRLCLIRGHGGKSLPGGINIFLLVGTGKQRFLSDKRAEQRQGRTPLFSGDTRLPEACLLVFIQRAQVDATQDLFRAVILFLRDLQLGREQALLKTLGIVKIFRQLAEQLCSLLGFSLFQQCTNGE